MSEAEVQISESSSTPPPSISGGDSGGNRGTPQAELRSEERRQTQLAPDPKTRGKLKDQLRASFDAARDPADKIAPRKGKEAAAVSTEAKGGVAGRLAKTDTDKSATAVDPSKGAAGVVAALTEPAPAPGEAKKADSADGTTAAPTPAVQPPTSWSKEAQETWATLPAPVQAAVAKREKEMSDGIASIKNRYGEIEQALAPRRQLLSQTGHSEGSAVNQLFAWHEALAGPNRMQAFAALARAHNIDFSQLLPQGSQQQPSPTSGAQPGGSPGAADPVQDYLRAYLQPVLSRIDNVAQVTGGLQNAWQRQQQDAIAHQLEVFAQDKPHFNTVRRTMGQLMSPTLDRSGNVIAPPAATSLQDAYDKAIWSMPEIRTAMLAEEAAKRDAEVKARQDAEASKLATAEAERKAKAELDENERRKREAETVEKARRANVSLRGGTPVGVPTTGASRGETVGSTLRNAIRDTRAAI